MQTRVSCGFWMGPLGGAASAFYIVGKPLSLLQEINSQKHKARGWDFLRSVSLESACCVCQAKGKPGYREQKVQAGFLFTCIFRRFPRPYAFPNSD